MNELQQELNHVYKMLGTVRVSGDDVEMMAAVKAGLRKCYQMAAEEKTSGEGEET